MGTRNDKPGAAKANVLAALDAAPTNSTPRALLLRNASREVLVVKSENLTVPDLVLGLQSEVVVPEEWAKNRGLRRLIGVGDVEALWVDPLYEPKVLPRVEDAPVEIVPDQSYEREYARQIALQDEPDALAAIQVTVRLPNTREVDLRYMKETFRRVLELACWLEERTQKRKKVLAAINRRLDEIRAL